MKKNICALIVLSIAISLAYSSVIGYAFDYNSLKGTINGRDAYYVQNEASKQQFADRSVTGEYIDPLTGNLTLIQTDLVLPGKDGLDLKLERYYSSSQAEFFGKSVDLTGNVQMTVPAGMYVVEVTVHDINSNQEYMYYYPYEDANDAKKKQDEINSLNNVDTKYMYSAVYIFYNQQTTLDLPYLYQSDTEKINYQRMRYNLGAGWAFSFPSIQLIKDDPMNFNEVPKGIYYHTGNGSVYTVKNSGTYYWFENYIGKDYQFELDNPGNIGQSAIIKYLCRMQDGTRYYFGEFGQLLVIMDNYDNKIIIDYTPETFYGRDDCRLIKRITDTVGRVVTFNYIGDDSDEFNYIDVTVTHPSTTDVLTMQYVKQMIYLEDENQIEPVLLRFINGEDEVTDYLPVPEVVDGEIKYYAARAADFTFTDKSFDSPMVSATGDIAHSWVYLLGEIRYPRSYTFYEYEPVTRNLGYNGITQAYRINKRYDKYQLYDEEGVSCEGLSKNYKEFVYGTDYTGYPYYPCTELMSSSAGVYSYEKQYLSDFNYKRIQSDYKYIDGEKALLLVMRTVSENRTKDNEVNYIYNYSNFSTKQPTLTTIQKLDKDDHLLYKTYVETRYYLDDARYGKIEYQTKPLLSADFNNSEIKEKYKTIYNYDTNNGKLRYTGWYQNETDSYSEGCGYTAPYYRLSYVISPEEKYVDITYEGGKTVTKRTMIYNNGNNDEKVEEYYTSATNYAYPSKVKKYYTDSEGNEQYRTTHYNYNMLLGLVKEKIDNDGNVTAYDYDHLGRVRKVTYPIYFAYSNANNKTLPILVEKTINYEDVGIDYSPEPSPYGTLREYTELSYYNNTDPNNKILFFISQTQNFYDGFGNLVRNMVADKVNGVDDWVTTTNFYNDDCLLERTVDALDNKTSYHYDSQGRVIKTIDSYGNYCISKYDIPTDEPGFKSLSYFVAAENISNGSYSDADRENIAESYYNIWGQVTEKRSYKSYPNDYVRENYYYDIAGNQVAYIDAKRNLNSDGYTATYSYDGLNRIKTAKNAKDEISTSVYDTKNNVTEMYMSGPNNTSQKIFTKAYDEQGRLISNTDTLTKEQTYEYNSLGQLESYIDRNGTYFSYEYDALSRATNTIAVNEFGYEFRNQILNPFGANTVWDINYEQAENGYEGSLHGIVSNEYSINGKLLSKISQYPAYAGMNYYGYQDYTYDALGRVTRSASGNYDSINNTTWGSYTNNTYNKIRIEKVQINGQGTLNLSDSVNVKYNFYPDGKLKSVIFPPLSGGQILKSEYTYDGLGRLDTLINTKGSTVISSYDYDYDDNGNITDVIETVNGDENTISYGYDALNRLETIKSTKGNDDSYNYDFRGNRKANYEKTDLLTPESVSYSYDELNRLYDVNKDGTQTKLDYTADGLRYVKKVGGQNTFYVYDQNGRLNAEVKRVSDGTKYFLYPVANYIWGPDRVLAKLDKLTGNSYYYIYNGHSDVIQVLDTSGNIVNSYDYDVWGNFITKNETIQNPFTYFCQTYDESTGLYYLRARYYDPKTGRFTQEDSAYDGLNWYVYGNNNPILYIDPSGLLTCYVNVNSNSYLNVRAGPSTSSKSINRLTRGTAVDFIDTRRMVKADGYSWVQLRSGGWVAYEFLSAYPPTTPEAVEATADGRRSLPPTGDPNSKDTLYNPDGTPKQERKYGPDGEPEYDDDYNHAGDGHGIGFPHRHPWEDGERSKNPIPVPPAEASSTRGYGAVIVGGVVTIIELALYLYGKPIDIPGN